MSKKTILAGFTMCLLTNTAVAGIEENGIQLNGIQLNGIQLNGIQLNGIQLNGIQLNGIQLNGIQLNGIQLNGIQLNGIQLNGIQLNGIQLNGIQLNGTQLEVNYIGAGAEEFPYSCPHIEAVTGAGMGECSPCAAVVNDIAPWCGLNWDQSCVDIAMTSCVATVAPGSTLAVNSTDGVPRLVTLTSTAAEGDVWWNQVNWGLSHTPLQTGGALSADAGNACVAAVVAAVPSCGTLNWDAGCVAAAASLCTSGDALAAAGQAYGESVCGDDGQSVFLAGRWASETIGQPGGGGKVAAEGATIGCRHHGATAKCVDLGYKPWISTAKDELHQGCVRMVRADFCGDGVAWTQDGNLIDISDYAGIQSQTHDIASVFEATWNKGGAVTMNHALGSRRATAGAAVTFHEYAASHACQTRFLNRGQLRSALARTDKRKGRLLRSDRPYEWGPGGCHLSGD